MRLRRLRVEHLAVIREADIAFGPGLNVLYGPNDLGKSTLADAVRLALLLPHTSTYCDPYISWSGGQDPVVELTFDTESQRVWRVRKQFGRGGSSVLQESRDGVAFDDIERARRVDARIREILRWGIPEPGGTGAGKGLPTSFLATALLSTQGDVADVLNESLADDPAVTGKERLAAALQAVAQDPLFAVLLREVQERRDEAYTDSGLKKTARGSVFKVAADRVKEAREERDRLQKIVEDSESVERHLRDLAARRNDHHRDLEAAQNQLSVVERAAQQEADRATAAERVRSAHEAVLSIQRLDAEISAADLKVGQLAAVREQCETVLTESQAAVAAADAALKAAESTASAGTDPETAETMARQGLELRKAAAEHAAREAQRDVDAVSHAHALINAAAEADQARRRHQLEVTRALERRSQATERERAANDNLRRCDLLERALQFRAIEKQVAKADADVQRRIALEADSTRIASERAALAERRTAMVLPASASVVSMRRLATELASARGVLDVGLVMTVTPTAPVVVQVRKDDVTLDEGTVVDPLEIEADAAVEARIGDIATVAVRGGRRDAQEKVRLLEERWRLEVLPQLTAAAATDLDALDAKLNEARELDSRIARLDGELESLKQQIATVADAPEILRQSKANAEQRRQALEGVELDALETDLEALGAETGAALRKLREEATLGVEGARAAALEAAMEQSRAEEQARGLGTTFEAAVVARDAALSPYAGGLAEAKTSAQERLNGSLAEQQQVALELVSLQNTIEARQRERDQMLTAARQAAANAREALGVSQEARTTAIADHASEQGRLIQLRSLRSTLDLAAAELSLREATATHDALPSPERPFSPEEVIAARNVVARVQRDLQSVEQEIQRTQGALEQVGGSVARERLHDAIETLELAERNERELETDYEAWKLLLDQMKEADAAQASNLGQALGPAIADRFRALTEQRYQGVQLTADLGTDGVLIAGAVRASKRLSVGTREQLSTLYRLCLGEYLQTVVVLDDQLVQSDQHRMDWFRSLLAEKARSFQIVVFTCRPDDYLAAAAMVPAGGPTFVDGEEGLVRAIDLGRAVQRR
jgi:hypothetical protein